MIELTADAFSSVQPMLGDFQDCVPLNAVLDGNHAGRVFVENDSPIFYWEGSHAA